METRAGIGYDVHRFGDGRRLILGGALIEGERGLVGHSDADVVTHAVIDALLGAAGLGDIGSHFPPQDARFLEADSVALLQGAVELLGAAGWRVVNVDSTVIAERPRLLPYIAAMRSRLSGALGVDLGQVSVKAKTNEGLGFLGAGEAIAAMAVALIERQHAGG